MISLALSIALLGASLADDSDRDLPPLPEAPENQVLDRMEWLNTERRLALESELNRLKKEHGINLYVVIWDRRLPDDQQPEDLARSLGEFWSPGQLWATVLLTPEAINRPLAIIGGIKLDEQNRTHLENAARYSMEFGTRAWSDQGCLEQTALVLGEELMFAQQRMLLEQQTSAATAPGITSSESPLPSKSLLPLIVAGVVLLLMVALALKRRHVRRPKQDPAPSVFTFPTRQVDQRLGAPWSGGTSLITKVTAPPLD